MAIEATASHEHPGTPPDHPISDLTIGPRGGIRGGQTLCPNSRQGEVATAEVVHLRFDRIEDRLILLERMLGELIHLRGQPQTVAVRSAPELQVAATPAQSQAQGQTQTQSQAEATELPPWDQRNDDEELDVSVRDYIERLLKQGSVGPLERPETGRTPAIEQPNAAPRQDAEAESSPTAMEPPVQVEVNVSVPAAAHRFEVLPDATSGPASLTPQRLRPERDANLDAMREVANLSATAAIRTYEKSQAARKTVDRLPLLLIGLVCGLMLLYSGFSSGEKSMLVGAAVAFVGAALTAWQVLFILRRWLAASQPVRDP